MKKYLLELYSNYLLSSFSYKAYGLSGLSDKHIGHDEITAFFKPEKLEIKHNLNLFALKTKHCVNALKTGFQKLQELKE